MQARQVVHKLGEPFGGQLRAAVGRRVAAWTFRQARGNASQAVVPTTTAKQDTKLAQIIKGDIRATGPVSVARYMQYCLSHPTDGYYAQGDVFGEKGDFITSPEISQIFGELVAIWLLTRYLAAGSPARCRLVELGPGRGTLMDDVLRTLSSFPAIASAIKSVYLVENSLKMQEVQKDKLSARTVDKGIDLEWSDKIDDVPESEDFTMLIAHEFFDAMPINVFEKREEGFREVMISLTPTDPPNLQYALSPTPTPLSTALPATSPRFPSLPVGSRIEIAQDSFKIMRKVGELLGGKNGKGQGAGLVIDYGGDKAYGTSFRAFRGHKMVDVFDKPGTADLTANVDFAYLKESIDGLATPLGPIPQSQFLLSLGLQPRLTKLLSSATDEKRRADLQLGANRLIDRLGMGSQYQVMGVVAASNPEAVYPFN